MDMNVPMVNVVSAQVANTQPQQTTVNEAVQKTKSSSSAKNEVSEFKNYFDKYKSETAKIKDNSTNGTLTEAAPIKTTEDTGDVLKGVLDTNENLKTDLKDEDLKKALETPENLLMLLIGLYSEKGDIKLPEELDVKSGEGIKNHSDKLKVNNLQDIIKAILSEGELPKELKSILTQYEGIAASPSDKQEIAENSLLNKLFPKLLDSNQNIGQATQNNVEEFKHQVIHEIKNVLQKLDGEGTENPKLPEFMNSRPLTLLKEILSKDIKDSSQSSNETKIERIVNKAEVVKVKDSNTENKTIKTASTASDDKDDNILKNILQQDNGTKKQEGKVNLLMNFMNSAKSGDTEVAKQNGQVVVNRATFADDLFKAIKFIDTNNLKELKVNIKPKELGELAISVTMESGKLKASISAGSKEAYNLLNSNLADIKNSLSTNDIKIQDVSISIYNGDTTFFKDGSQNQGEQRQSFGTKAAQGSMTEEDDLVIDNSKDSKIDSQINMLA